MKTDIDQLEKLVADVLLMLDQMEKKQSADPKVIVSKSPDDSRNSNQQERSNPRYLQLVDLERGLSKNQEAMLRCARRSLDGFLHRLKSVDMMRSTGDLKAQIEVEYCKTQNKYTARISQRDELITLIVSQNRRDKIRNWMDHDNRPIVPWKRIQEGETWITEIRMNPYRVYDNWVPDNLVSMQKYSKNEFIVS